MRNADGFSPAEFAYSFGVLKDLETVRQASPSPLARALESESLTLRPIAAHPPTRRAGQGRRPRRPPQQVARPLADAARQAHRLALDALDRAPAHAVAGRAGRRRRRAVRLVELRRLARPELVRPRPHAARQPERPPSARCAHPADAAGRRERVPAPGAPRDARHAERAAHAELALPEHDVAAAFPSPLACVGRREPTCDAQAVADHVPPVQQPGVEHVARLGRDERGAHVVADSGRRAVAGIGLLERRAAAARDARVGPDGDANARLAHAGLGEAPCRLALAGRVPERAAGSVRRVARRRALRAAEPGRTSLARTLFAHHLDRTASPSPSSRAPFVPLAAALSPAQLAAADPLALALARAQQARAQVALARPCAVALVSCAGSNARAPRWRRRRRRSGPSAARAPPPAGRPARAAQRERAGARALEHRVGLGHGHGHGLVGPVELRCRRGGGARPARARAREGARAGEGRAQAEEGAPCAARERGERGGRCCRGQDARREARAGARAEEVEPGEEDEERQLVSSRATEPTSSSERLSRAEGSTEKPVALFYTRPDRLFPSRPRSTGPAQWCDDAETRPDALERSVSSFSRMRRSCSFLSAMSSRWYCLRRGQRRRVSPGLRGVEERRVRERERERTHSAL